MVTASDHAWDSGEYVWDVSRILEHTPPDVRGYFSTLHGDVLISLSALPTLFLYERGTEGQQRVGKITKIQRRQDQIRILFDFDPTVGPLSNEQVDSLKWDLDINDYEFSRTHWAVKDVDLNEVLSGIRVAAEAVDEALHCFEAGETLEELIAAIQRDIKAAKYAATLDRLHTYCMKRFASVLESRSITVDLNEPLNSRVGKYVKALEGEGRLHDLSRTIVRNSISIFDKFNHVRNNMSLAHDNELMDHNEAQFVFESIIAILRFVRRIEDRE